MTNWTPPFGCSSENSTITFSGLFSNRTVRKQQLRLQGKGKQHARVHNEVVYNTASILPVVNFMLLMHVFLMAYYQTTNIVTQNLDVYNKAKSRRREGVC